MNITISNEIKKITPEFSVAIMECKVKVEEESNGITELINMYEHEINESINISEVVTLPVIKEARDAYKKYGKDPSRYRLAVESLIRRLSKGNKLYRINNVVDLGNIISIKTRKSVAVLDYNQIEGNVQIRLGQKDDEYYGIGRGKINIENIPLYEDEIGPFGSSTSDTERTMIRKDTNKILLFIISFSGQSDLKREIEYAKYLYETHARASDFLIKII